MHWDSNPHPLVPKKEDNCQKIAVSFPIFARFFVTTPSLELGNLSPLRRGLPQVFTPLVMI